MPDIIQHYYESDVYRRGSYSDLTHEIALVRKEIEAADNLFQIISGKTGRCMQLYFPGKRRPKTIQFSHQTGQAALSVRFLTKKSCRSFFCFGRIFVSIPFLQEVPGSCFVQSIDPVPDNLPAFSLLFLVSPFAPTP